MGLFRKARDGRTTDPNIERKSGGAWVGPVFLLGVLFILIIGTVSTVIMRIDEARRAESTVTISAPGSGAYEEASLVRTVSFTAGSDGEAAVLGDALKELGYTMSADGAAYEATGLPGTGERAVDLIEAGGGTVTAVSTGRRDEDRSEASAFIAAYLDGAGKLEAIADAMSYGGKLRITGADTVSMYYDGEGVTEATVRVYGEIIP